MNLYSLMIDTKTAYTARFVAARPLQKPPNVRSLMGHSAAFALPKAMMAAKKSTRFVLADEWLAGNPSGFPKGNCLPLWHTILHSKV